ARFGPAFMRSYYRAWAEVPGAIALAAIDEQGELVGVLLGATDPAAHMRLMVRRHGLRLGTRMMGFAAVHPALARDLVVTRGRRYLRGVVRLLSARLRPPSESSSAALSGTVVGEVTHVLVRPDCQGSGIGRALVTAAVALAQDAKLDELVLVTPPDLAARDFYERLGWLADGEMTSRSNEPFLRYRFPLHSTEGSGNEGPTPVIG
ncbi:MAG: GNAT family N-acetyltransferase, partial [Acidimicrobiales bacterium]